jgi:hypothetical protein
MQNTDSMHLRIHVGPLTTRRPFKQSFGTLFMCLLRVDDANGAGTNDIP